MGEGHAIATAINTMKRWAAGGGNVSEAVKAAAAKALAELKAKGAAAHMTKSVEPDADVLAEMDELLSPSPTGVLEDLLPRS